MTAKILAAVLAPLAVVLGPHLFLMLALTAALAFVLLLLWRIDVLTMSTGWRVVPVPARRGAPAW